MMRSKRDSPPREIAEKKGFFANNDLRVMNPAPCQSIVTAAGFELETLKLHGDLDWIQNDNLCNPRRIRTSDQQFRYKTGML